MKTLALSACLAVASTASAADLKDPAEVAADWKGTMEAALAPLLAKGPLGLTAAGSPAPNFQSAAPAPVRRPRLKNDVMEVPPGWQVDPKMQRDVPGETPPKGAKPWYYRGQKFWIIPVAESR